MRVYMVMMISVVKQNMFNKPTMGSDAQAGISRCG